MFAITPLVDMDSADAAMVFDCANTSAVATVSGLNTLGLTAQATPAPDMIAISATPTNDGTLTTPVNSFGTFAASAVNIGAAGELTVTVDDNGRALPLSTLICRTNPATGACVTPATPAAASVSSLAQNEVATFSIFVRATGAIAFDPANNRLFVRLRTGDNVARGATSVAVRTP